MQPRVFCALDTNALTTATLWAREIGPITGALKLGLEFFNRFGPQGVEAVLEACPEAALFLDLKFHDIPNTVAGAVRSISQQFAPAYLNVHAAGGVAMMQAGKAACHPKTRVLGVTVLTCLDDGDMDAIGYGGGTAEQVIRFAALTHKAELDGVVCSAHDIAALRAAHGPSFALVVPGIRPLGKDAGDQKRIMSPADAVAHGATDIVVGRPITQATDPAAAAQAIMDEIALL